MFGGQSTAGNLLGSAGGALTTGFITSSLGLMGSGGAAAFFSNPITAIAGGALLVGSVLLGKAKQRKADESVVDTYWTKYAQVTDALTRDVRANRIDGDSALAQAMAARQEAIDQINQIKTKSVRESRLRNQIPQIDNGSLATLKAAIRDQGKRRDLMGRYVPEFAAGGIVPGPFGSKVPVYAHAGEVILNQQQIRRLGSGALAEAGVPGVKGDSGSGVGNITLTPQFELHIGTQTHDELIQKGLLRKNNHKALGQALTNTLRYT
jgi:hypothetical protein